MIPAVKPSWSINAKLCLAVNGTIIDSKPSEALSANAHKTYKPNTAFLLDSYKSAWLNLKEAVVDLFGLFTFWNRHAHRNLLIQLNKPPKD